MNMFTLDFVSTSLALQQRALIEALTGSGVVSPSFDAHTLTVARRALQQKRYRSVMSAWSAVWELLTTEEVALLEEFFLEWCCTAPVRGGRHDGAALLCAMYQRGKLPCGARKPLRRYLRVWQNDGRNPPLRYPHWKRWWRAVLPLRYQL